MTEGNVLVTGGAGFIGSHACKALAQSGYVPCVYDDLSTGQRRAVKWGPFIEGTILDADGLGRALQDIRPVAVMHFAASAYVGESVTDPGKYYRNNVGGMQVLLDACRNAGVKDLIFSSSCATYGLPATLPITEASPQQPINPYGRTKLICEHMLKDYASAYGIRYAGLRYFNACGADPEGELRELHDPETHIVPRALMAAFGRIDRLEIYGDDYPTEDGTCVRDYVHVCDLASAHVLALDYLRRGGEDLFVNIGAGHGHSIKQLLAAISRETGRPVPHAYRARRPGDPPALIADTSLATARLGFQARHSQIDCIVRTAAPSFALKSNAGKVGMEKHYV